ncbi:hypothetical protein NL676_008511 [Syzygium grande]|nr:hypothetical protein NL676_008511 [Syzygium grande]
MNIGGSGRAKDHAGPRTIAWGMADFTLDCADGTVVFALTMRVTFFSFSVRSSSMSKAAMVKFRDRVVAMVGNYDKDLGGPGSNGRHGQQLRQRSRRSRQQWEAMDELRKSFG